MVFHIERHAGLHQAKRCKKGGVGNAVNPKFRVFEDVEKAPEQPWLRALHRRRVLMATQAHKPDHCNRQHTVEDGRCRKPNRIRDHRRQRNGYYHCNQLKNLTHCIGFRPLRLRAKQLREQSAVICIDEGIQRAGQDIHQQHVGKCRPCRKAGRRIEEQDEA